MTDHENKWWQVKEGNAESQMHLPTEILVKLNIKLPG